MLGGDLPSAQHPAAPACISDEQRPTTVLPGGIDVQRPPPIVSEGLGDGVATGDVESLQVGHEATFQHAHLARGERHGMLIEQRHADLFALAVVHEALPPHEHHHVVTCGALGGKSLREAGGSLRHPRA